MEPILVRHDTKEVIEGNSRLAVYRILDKKRQEGEWDLIPCNIVSSLTDDQQAAFLNQIHVKGKTRWSRYEKANFAYVRKEQGWSMSKIANRCLVNPKQTIRTRVKTIEDMKDNGDAQQSHFSLLRGDARATNCSRNTQRIPASATPVSWRALKIWDQTRKTTNLRRKNSDKNCLRLRRNQKFCASTFDRTIDLDEAYQSAKISHVEEKVKKARVLT